MRDGHCMCREKSSSVMKSFITLAANISSQSQHIATVSSKLFYKSEASLLFVFSGLTQVSKIRLRTLTKKDIYMDSRRFLNFNRLPLELLSRIWQLASPGSRLLEAFWTKSWTENPSDTAKTPSIYPYGNFDYPCSCEAADKYQASIRTTLNNRLARPFNKREQLDSTPKRPWHQNKPE